MNYDKHYSKLDRDVYTSIRKENSKNLKIGDLEPQFIKRLFYHVAKVVKIHRKVLNQVSTNILMLDTDELDRNGAVALLESFYGKINEEKDTFFIFTFQKLPDLDHEHKQLLVKSKSDDKIRAILTEHDNNCKKVISFLDWELAHNGKDKVESTKKVSKVNSLGIEESEFNEFLKNWKKQNLKKSE